MSNRNLSDQPSNDEEAIRALIEAGHRAHHDKDARAIVAGYARNAVVFDLAPPLLSRMGTDPGEISAWLDTWDGPLARDSRALEVTVSGNLAFCHGFFGLRGTPRGADGPISLWMRATLCLGRVGGTWKIVHEHTSVPFYMDGSFRAAIDLEP